MDRTYLKFFNNYWVEKLFILFLTLSLTGVILVFSFLMSNNLPRSKELIPPKCDYDRGWFFTAPSQSYISSIVKTGVNQTIYQSYPFDITTQHSTYVSQNNQIWTIMSEQSKIAITSALTFNVVSEINLGTINCFNPTYIAYSSQAYNKKGQVWISCANSSKITIFDPSIYSQIGSISNPTNITGTNTVDQIAIGPGYAFVVYAPNIWVSYKTNYPFFQINNNGTTPGGGLLTNFVDIWRRNFPESSSNALYILTSQNIIFKSLWDGNFNVLTETNIPSPATSLNAITTSPDEKYVYSISSVSSGLWMYYTNNMSEVPGTGYGQSVQLTSPLSFATGLYNNQWQMLVTSTTQTNACLLDLDNNSGKISIPNNFVYVSTNLGCKNVVYFLQQCPCEFC